MAKRKVALAGWMVHLRVPDKLTSKNSPLSQTHFIVGNLVPNCGETAKGGQTFTSGIRRDMHDLDHLHYKEHSDFRALFVTAVFSHSLKWRQGKFGQA